MFGTYRGWGGATNIHGGVRHPSVDELLRFDRIQMSIENSIFHPTAIPSRTEDKESPLAARPIVPLQNGMLFHAITKPHRGVDIEQISPDLHESIDVQGFENASNMPDDLLPDFDVLKGLVMFRLSVDPYSPRGHAKPVMS